MDTDRAREILNSKGVIEVVHNGQPVWIEGIRGSNADVMYIETKKRTEVPLSRLMETHPM